MEILEEEFRLSKDEERKRRQKEFDMRVKQKQDKEFKEIEKLEKQR